MYASDGGKYNPNFSNIKIGLANMELEKQNITMTGLPLEAAAAPASRSSNTSIDEKLDSLIYIQTELISLLKEKLL